ncbi:hypothetical protein GUITHDRAFT_100443 [Guillardia theta CCMP2712]|uniref:Uncharacterized protein n=1 Tax=Guillardia theta (strain CCMP2712) TaxID=905079 RepID=L1K1E1_GUITC|nr:hypothetical protein GUITHDRAFT_100443 [Guillardia theta CCMP2712]EKX54193.1 hypothetical protein GUITHDRAFT_100443 [Guillardia theta CCMP2712]|eukprot:XP_005841173.1 hypothetical protein GUITHDRAFT_100443 [Guillardia theta CCMP2712]
MLLGFACEAVAFVASCIGLAMACITLNSVVGKSCLSARTVEFSCGVEAPVDDTLPTCILVRLQQWLASLFLIYYLFSGGTSATMMYYYQRNFEKVTEA